MSTRTGVELSGVCQMEKHLLCPAAPGAVEGYRCGCGCHVPKVKPVKKQR